MLDSHPQLAIPAETGFIPGCARLSDGDGDLRDAFLRWVTTFPPEAPAWNDFGIPIETFRSELLTLPSFNVSDGLRTFYRLYARRFGKERSGDKTPIYAKSMSVIARLLPEARFIHIIRDGRDVALSWRQTWFSPGNDMRTLAREWSAWIERARAESRFVPHYMEVRFEQLVSEPEAVLRGIASFVELPYESAMLDYPLRSAARLAEHGPRISSDGRLLVSRETRLWQQRNTATYPDRSRAFAWRATLDEDEHTEFTREAGQLLVSLGYER
jgi:sulfotransferase family protein